MRLNKIQLPFSLSHSDPFELVCDLEPERSIVTALACMSAGKVQEFVRLTFNFQAMLVNYRRLLDDYEYIIDGKLRDLDKEHRNTKNIIKPADCNIQINNATDINLDSCRPYNMNFIEILDSEWINLVQKQGIIGLRHFAILVRVQQLEFLIDDGITMEINLTNIV